MFATFINAFGTDRDAKLGPDGAGSAQKGDFLAILSPKRRVQKARSAQNRSRRAGPMLYKSLCVVITDWGDLRDQIFSRTGFAPSVPSEHPPYHK